MERLSNGSHFNFAANINVKIAPKKKLGNETPVIEKTVQDLSNVECSYCGGLGHQITNCTKLKGTMRTQQLNQRDMVTGGTY